jgi:hypothetical protein
VVKHLPNKHKALSSTPNTMEGRKKEGRKKRKEGIEIRTIHF